MFYRPTLNLYSGTRFLIFFAPKYFLNFFTLTVLYILYLLLPNFDLVLYMSLSMFLDHYRKLFSNIKVNDNFF